VRRRDSPSFGLTKTTLRLLIWDFESPAEPPGIVLSEAAHEAIYTRRDCMNGRAILSREAGS